MKNLTPGLQASGKSLKTNRDDDELLHVFCGDYKCSHSVVIDTDCWPERLRLSDLEALVVCRVCGHRGADVRPDFQEAEPRVAASAGEDVR